MSYIAAEGSFLKRAHDVRTIAETRRFYSEWAETYDADLTEEHDYVQPRRCAEMLSRFLPDRGAAHPRCRLRYRTGRRRSRRDRLPYAIDGCDLTPGMLEKARETRPSTGGCSRPT